MQVCFENPILQWKALLHHLLSGIAGLSFPAPLRRRTG
jgi:hypothetical protein